ncbi:NmrA family NAD(P)-binding protein [Cryobacterium arcticum]|uniref:NmrA family protein n=1 Tax=Cryobacterium arcticum TaxID=670052 RepID=A0A317ZR49_9MICO|nr:NmrA family NAD(P)-binding protein [Cryobacterium arcticum]PXA67234.1 NmrA family protein [Cryobacterium arcticum]
MSTLAPTGPIAIVGATGSQGGAVARALRRRGVPVVALVRDATGPAALELAALGIGLVEGDLDQPESLDRLLRGASGLFTVVLSATATDPASEVRHGTALVTAAERAGVRHLVHSSVSGWEPGHSRIDRAYDEAYWNDKEAVERAARESGIPIVTLLKPAIFMDNFVPPRLAGMFREQGDGVLAAATAPHVPLPLVAVDDIGEAAAAAFFAPEIFDRAEVELAGDVMTFPQIAELLSEAFGRSFRYVHEDPDALVERGHHPGWVAKQVWYEQVNHRARPAHSAVYGLKPRTFAEFLAAHPGTIHST